MPRPTEFIDRDEEYQFIEEALIQIKQPANPRPTAQMFEFYGLAGLGKTMLLDVFQGQCRDKGVPFVDIDFAHMDPDPLKARAHIIERIVKFLGERGNAPDYALRKASDEYWSGITLPNASTVEPAVEQALTNLFVAYVAKSVAKPEPLALFFDATDKAQPAILGWLNAHVLLSLMDLPPLLIVFAGRSQVEQWTGRVKREISAYPMKPFLLEDTEEHLKALPRGGTYTTQAERVHDLTLGHPRANVEAVERLDRLGIKPTEIEKRQKEVVLYLMQMVDDYILKEVPPSLKPVLKLMAVPRSFSPLLLKELIAQFVPSQDGNQEIAHYTRMVGDLIGTRLVFYSERGYAVNDLLRRMLNRYMAIIEPARFIAINEYIAQWHLERIEEDNAKNIYWPTREYLYHLALALQTKRLSGTTVEVEETLKNDLDEILRHNFRTRDGNADVLHSVELEQALQDDPELKGVLSEGIGELAKTIQQFRRSPGEIAKSILSIDLQKASQFKISLQTPGLPLVKGELVTIGPDSLPTIQDVLSDLNQSAEWAKLLYTLCLPDAIQRQIKGSQIPIQLVTNFADVLWELMHDGEEFLGVRLATARQIEMVLEPRANQKFEGAEKRFLFIVNPTNDLPGAEKEVEAIIASLGNKITAKVLAGQAATPRAVLSELRSGQYGVIHYAGHAFFDARKPRNSGLVLAAERVLAADEIERVLRGRPVVFLNACTGGKAKSGEYAGGFMGSYTDGLAASLLLGGALACIGPLWDIEDRSAARLATEFYQRAMKNERLGESLRQARVAVRQAMPETDVWAAFTMYGDVNSSLTGMSSEGFPLTDDHRKPAEVSASEIRALRRLEEAQLQAQAIEKEKVWQQTELLDLKKESDQPPTWTQIEETWRKLNELAKRQK